MDLRTGREFWVTGVIDARPSDLLVLASTVVVGTGGGDLVALGTADGETRWRVVVSPAGRAVHAPAATGELVVTTTDDGVVSGIDGASGHIRWQVRPETDGEPIGAPVATDDVVYVGMAAEAASGRLTALSAETGAELWSLGQNVTAPSIADGVGYTGSAAGRVAAVDLRTGAELWVAQYNGNVRAPAIAGNVVYVAADGERVVAALDRGTGRELWRIPVDGPNPCCVAVSDGLLLVGASTGQVNAIGGDGKPVTAATRPSTSVSMPSETKSTVSETVFHPALLWSDDASRRDLLPFGLALSPDGTVWVTDGAHDRFAIYASDGAFQGFWAGSASGGGKFDLTRANGDPFGQIAFASDGSFDVLDVGNFEIDRFGADRSYLGSFSHYGRASAS